ncbi:MAG: hypothetical protein HY054_06020 [Proteobacteria bacterium]|nr:hypothetical protein [Pseudomonadota bacterium]
MKAWFFPLVAVVTLLPAVANAGATPETRDCQTGNARRGECITSSTQPVAPQVTAHQTTRMPPPPQTAHNDAQRRRSGKHIPDAELIGPRGAL